MGGVRNEIVSNIPGTVIRVLCSVGDTIKKGDSVVILESMKMEIDIKSEVDGRVLEVHVSEGDSIDRDALIAVVLG
jgi:biotin carboxyl carrier protein